MLSSGFGMSISSSFGYHFIPSRIYLGLYSQAIIAFDELGTGKATGWGAVGVSLGANVGDINPDLLKPYKDKLNEGAILSYLIKEIITKSNIVFSDNKIKMVAGIRTKRKDSYLKIISSKIANYIRNIVLKDGCQDTGCSLKIFEKKIFQKDLISY